MHSLVSLAKKTVETYIKKGEIIEPPANLPEGFLKKRAGTFITIEEMGKLRGCIGTYLPKRENIAEEIIYNAIAAATEDYRFGPVKEEELPYLSYTVYILSEPELIKNIKELDPKEYGIIVKTRPNFSSKNLNGQDSIDVMFDGVVSHKTGLLLPGLEGINTIDEQISIACQKGGIDSTQEEILIYKFEVKKHQ